MNIKNIPVFTFVIFTQAKINFNSELAGDFYNFVGCLNKKQDVLEDRLVEELYIKLTNLKENNTVTDKQHIENIHKLQAKIDNNICPRCNGQLIVRNGKYGDFYGCSNYPTCKFIKKK